MPEITDTLDTIKSLAESKNIRELRTITEDMNDADIADAIEQLEPEERVVLFRALSRDMAAEGFAHLIPDTKKPDELMKAAEKFSWRSLSAFDEPLEAVNESVKRGSDLTLVCGSLYMIGYIRHMLYNFGK